MNPLEIANSLRDSYLRYLETSFHLKDESLRKQFRELLADKTQPPLVRSPILEVSPGYRPGASISDLLRERVLTQSFSKITGANKDRPLYLHQERALRRAISEERNLVVATGTGSGKTETFFYPILDHLAREYEAGSLNQPGVRALLLYPMNALANDQIARLRNLLREFPEITFGRYTGETDTDYEAALDQYRAFHENEDPLPNELISRDQMRQAPPHILFTNYAMLEYLLIRPKDAELFTRNKWRFLVLDEVHTYSGATGIEIAMLIRRLKDRVVRSERGRLQCFATSATLGAGERDYPKIARFAEDLFGETFAAEDVIGPERIELANTSAVWGMGSHALYQSLQQLIRATESLTVDQMLSAARGMIPEGALRQAAKYAVEGNSGDETSKESRQRFLFHILSGDGRVQQLRKQLNDARALDVVELGGSEVVDLIALGAFARQSSTSLPLIPARYHILARALSGVHCWIDGDKKLQLLPKRARVIKDTWGAPAAVFELGSCNRCGEVLLVGIKEPQKEGTFLRQPPDVGDDPVDQLNWYSLRGASGANSIDEDDAIEDSADLRRLRTGSLSPMVLCRVCGRIGDKATFDTSACVEHACQPIDVYELENKKSRGSPRHCPSCLNFYGSVASRILTGKEVPVAVLTTALYQKLPAATGDEAGAQLPGRGRKLMMFSDSRQDAAFFAPFMDNTYNKFKQRRYLVRALSGLEPLDLEEWSGKTRKVAEGYGEWDESVSPAARRREAGRWVLREWIATDRRLALEGAGVVRFSLRRPTRFTGIPSLSARGLVDSTDHWTVIQILLDTIRYQGAVSFAGDAFDGIDPSDKEFEPRNFTYYLRGAHGGGRIHAWEPDGEHSNRRLDFLQRLYQRLGASTTESKEAAKGTLKEIWQMIAHSNGPLADLFEKGLSAQGEAGLLRLKPSWWQVSHMPADGVFKCDTCGTVTGATVRATCTLFRCTGTLKPYTSSEQERNHYFKLFSTMEPIPLKVREHTAQLVKREAFQTQQDFIAGRTNMLSCTTTFEMGVDVGDLQSVFMRNIPPSPGNYVQRAGRAGRRVDSVAIVVSYAQRRTHDLAYFDDWRRMVEGTVRAPVLHLENAKIVRRHVHAEALAEYFREHPEQFQDRVEALFDPSSPRPTEVLAFLKTEPKVLHDRLIRIVANNQLRKALGIEDWSWLATDRDSEPDSFELRLNNAARDIAQDWMALRAAEEAASKKATPAGYASARAYAQQLNTLKQRSLLGKLGTYGLMPKYGFPTEVVELKVRGGSKEANQVELERDMKLALSEFAPGNQVIAAQRVWTSEAIIMPTGERRLHEFRYWQCPTCRFFSSEPMVVTSTEAPQPRQCYCGTMLDASIYIYPEFGFSTRNTTGDRVGEERPTLKSFSETFFHDDSTDAKFLPLANCPGITYRETGQGWIHVINDNRQRYFHVCMGCGFVAPAAARFSKTANAAHFRPWSIDQQCGSTNTSLRRLALGYRYRTDVLELQFPPPRQLDSETLEGRHSLWLSVLYALVNSACHVLELDDRDIGGCLYYSARNQPSLVVFDTAQGGAGFVREIKNSFPEVLRYSQKLLECKSCAEDASCIACLRTYFNQRDHNRLKRGPAKHYLDALL